LMVFVWLVITCAVFCGFYFFDQYVIGHYGSYQAMLYEISDGQSSLKPLPIQRLNPLSPPD